MVSTSELAVRRLAPPTATHATSGMVILDAPLLSLTVTVGVVPDALQTPVMAEVGTLMTGAGTATVTEGASRATVKVTAALVPAFP